VRPSPLTQSCHCTLYSPKLASHQAPGCVRVFSFRLCDGRAGTEQAVPKPLPKFAFTSVVVLCRRPRSETTRVGPCRAMPVPCRLGPRDASQLYCMLTSSVGCDVSPSQRCSRALRRTVDAVWLIRSAPPPFQLPPSSAAGAAQLVVMSRRSKCAWTSKLARASICPSDRSESLGSEQVSTSTSRPHDADDDEATRRSGAGADADSRGHHVAARRESAACVVDV
jgi:hypothetical protein